MVAQIGLILMKGRFLSLFKLNTLNYHQAITLLVLVSIKLHSFIKVFQL